MAHMLKLSVDGRDETKKILSPVCSAPAARISTVNFIAVPDETDVQLLRKSGVPLRV